MLTVTVTDKDSVVIGEIEIVTTGSNCTDNEIANHIVENALAGKIGETEFVPCDRCNFFVASSQTTEIDMDFICHTCRPA